MPEAAAAKGPAPNSPESDSSNKKPPHPPGAAKPTVTSADIRANPRFSVGELVELALCSPEVGAVNFNILRMLLRDIVEKTGIDKSPVKINDLEAHQVENFKNYVQGTNVASPMPGVLRFGQQGPVPPGGPHPHHHGPPGSGPPGSPSSQGSRPPGPPPRPGGPPPPGAQQGGPQTPRTPRPPPGQQGGPVSGGYQAGSGGYPDFPQELYEKVARLEKQLESLYQLPANADLIEKVQSGQASMSVNDMWQIIQLNNRIAAAEAAIQKMASLIEDLAKNMGKVKGDTKNLKKDTDGLQSTSSDLLIQGQNLSDKYGQIGDTINQLQRELNEMKMGWKHDRDNLEKVLGVDLGKVPSFMKPKPKPQRQDGAQGLDAETPSSQFERGTQTFMHKPEKPPKPSPKPKKAPEQYIPPAEIAKMSPAEIARTITPEEISQMTPAVYKELTPEQKQAVNAVRKQGKTPTAEPPKVPMGVTRMTADEVAEIPAKQIAEQMPYEEAVALPPDVLEKMTDEQKEQVKKVVARGPPKKATSRRELKQKPKPPMGVAEMSQEQIDTLPPQKIMQQMGAEEAKAIPPDVLEKMTPDQKAAVQKVIQKAAAAPAGAPKKKLPSTKSIGIVTMTQEQLKEVPPEKIVEKMGFEEAKSIPPSVLEKMTPEQKEAVKKVVDQGPPPGYREKSGPRKTPLGLASMNPDELKRVSKSLIDQIPYEEAKNIPPEVLNQLTDEQRQAVDKVIQAGPDKPPSPDDEYDDEYDEYEEEEMALDEPRRVSGDKRKSGGSQKEQPPKRLTAGEITHLTEMPPEEISKAITPEQAASIPQEELQRRFTPKQVQEIEKLRQEDKRRRSSGARSGKSAKSDGRDSLRGDEGQVDMDKVAEMSPSELADNLTADHLEEMTEEDIASLPAAQAKVVKELKKSFEEEEEYHDRGSTRGSHEEHDHDHEEEEGGGRRRSRKQDKAKPERHRHRDKKHKHKHRKSDEEDGGDKTHSRVDVIKGPIPAAGEPLPPMTLEEYLSSLPPEEAANLAADAVQKELEKQYKHLQGMQRQLAQDIQEKMEFIYQKLLKEIAAQQMTTSPYMAIGGPETCLGPGICTGHGMPAGIAVCQFPEATEKEKQKSLLPGQAGAGQVSEIPEGKVCPGPGICPGSDVCPYCRADAQAKEALQSLKGPDKKAITDGTTQGTAPSAKGAAAAGAGPGGPGGGPHRVSDLDEALLQEMKSLMLLDLEKIREEMRSRKFGAYDEQDIVERLGAVWEALKILKHNEEALAIKIARQDAVMKKIPPKTIEKLQKVPDEHFDALITGNFGKGMGFLEERRNTRDMEVPHSLRGAGSVAGTGTGGGGGGGADREDIQTLFNNLANVIAECAEQKDRIDQLADTARILESGMVTKQMLLDALSDKADRGLINTKVSYDEFGNTIDELHTQLHNLMVEGYQRNENWKKVTADLAEELAEKLDKVELAPIRAFFKSHLRNLEEKVKNLSALIEEPDPAGTRKKLLRDYNCISCDRMVNISGVTNGPTLPTIGPIQAGHPTASKRALELHRMRMKKQFEPARKNINALERQGRQNQKVAQKAGTAPGNVAAQVAEDMDVMHVVNRYTGGSHTNVTNADVINAQRGPSKASAPEMVVLSNTAQGPSNGENRGSKPDVGGGAAPVGQSGENVGT